MKSIAIYSILFITLLLSCTTTPQKEAGKLIEVQSKDSIIRLSSFIKNIKIIKLETDSDLLISQVGKIQYIENKLYLSDMTGNCLFIFNDNGKRYKKIKRVGGGPGEYIRLMDFCITRDHSYILDFAKQTILQYDNDFNFIGQIKYPTFGSKFVLQHGNYWIYNEPAGKKDDYQYIVVDSTEKRVKEFLPRGFTQHTYNWAGVNSFYETPMK